MSIEVEHKGRVYRAVPEVRGCTDCDATSDMCEQNWNTCSVDEIIWIETIQEQTMQEQDTEQPRRIQQTTETALDKQVGSNHYKLAGIQPIEYIHANNLSFCEGNVVKYITRHRNKNKEEDVRKALHYCQLILKLEYGLDE